MKTNPARTVYRVELPGGDGVRQALPGQRPAGVDPRGDPPAESPTGVRERPRAARARRPGGRTARVGHAGFALARRELSHHAATDRDIPFLHCLEHVLPSLPPERTSGRRADRSRGHSASSWRSCTTRASPTPTRTPATCSSRCRPNRVPHFALIDLHAVSVGQPLSWPRESEQSRTVQPLVPDPREPRRPGPILARLPPRPHHASNADPGGAAHRGEGTGARHARLEPPLLGRSRIALPGNEPLLPQGSPRDIPRLRRPRPARRVPATTACRPGRGIRVPRRPHPQGLAHFDRRRSRNADAGWTGASGSEARQRALAGSSR